MNELLGLCPHALLLAYFKLLCILPGFSGLLKQSDGVASDSMK